MDSAVDYTIGGLRTGMYVCMYMYVCMVYVCMFMYVRMYLDKAGTKLKIFI